MTNSTYTASSPSPLWQYWRGLSGWNFYFLVKFGLLWAGYLNFHPLLNLVFMAFLLMPLPGPGLHRLRQDFKVPFVSLILFGENPAPVGRWVSVGDAQQAIGGLICGGKTVSGNLRDHELAFLFGEAQRQDVGSSAVATVENQGLHGVLAIGSRDPHHYKSTVGTLFLGYIAEVLGRVIPRVTQPLRQVR